MNEERVQRLAAFGHGIGAGVSLFGIAFHRLMTGKWIDRDVAIHAIALGYHGYSAWKHHKRALRYRIDPELHEDVPMFV